jgi:hypothetical protein
MMATRAAHALFRHEILCVLVLYLRVLRVPAFDVVLATLTFIHRWLGIAFCVLFAMWFATGIVMHFVPYPALTEIERVAGLAKIDRSAVRYDAATAARAAKIEEPVRIRLIERPDGPVYIVVSASRTAAVHAADLSPAPVESPALALDIAASHARARGLQARDARVAALEAHDQWSVPNNLDAHRPLYRIALGDTEGTELYVSSITGEVVRDATRFERTWNYAGSVSHWIYPTLLRRDWRAWDATVWTLALAALVTALAGAVLGVLRLRPGRGRLATPYRGWHAWHHWMGLACAVFVLTWIASGWLSMDHGRLFSTGKLDAAQTSALQGALVPSDMSASARLPVGAREIEWFVLGSRAYRRDRFDAASQRLIAGGEPSADPRGFLRADEITGAAQRLSSACGEAQVVHASEAYAIASAMPGAPVYRVVCGDAWLHIDGASGAALEKLDASRRAYRWFYSALHTLDFPALIARPALRTAVIVVLCALGLAFSATALVIAWRRITFSWARGGRRRAR